jgi:ATP-dependent Clp protease ATP-binding subunit ClpA
LDLAYDEARHLNNNYIGTEHLLLGLIREADGVAGRTLSSFGVDLDNARKAAVSLQSGQIPATVEPTSPPVSRFKPKADSAFESATRALLLIGLDQWHSPAELLLLLCLSGDSAHGALAEAGVDVNNLRRAFETDALNGATDNPRPSDYLEVILEAALGEAEKSKTELNSQHLLLAILQHDRTALDLLSRQTGFEDPVSTLRERQAE